MKNCRFCGNEIKQNELFCSNCGYDPKLDMTNPNFQSRKNIQRKRIELRRQMNSQRLISKGVRNFSVIGLLVVVFSIFYHYNFNFEAVLASAKSFIFRLSNTKIDLSRFSKSNRFFKI